MRLRLPSIALLAGICLALLLPSGSLATLAEVGVIPATTQLTPWPESLPP